MIHNLAGPVYIAGPMTGHIGFNYRAFHDAERFLRGMGFERIRNPARHFDGNQGLKWTTYLEAALQAVLGSSTVVALPGWPLSPGARLEVAVALAAGKTVQELSQGDLVPLGAVNQRDAVASLMGL